MNSGPSLSGVHIISLPIPARLLGYQMWIVISDFHPSDCSKTHREPLNPTQLNLNKILLIILYGYASAEKNHPIRFFFPSTCRLSSLTAQFGLKPTKLATYPAIIFFNEEVRCEVRGVNALPARIVFNVSSDSVVYAWVPSGVVLCSGVCT